MPSTAEPHATDGIYGRHFTIERAVVVRELFDRPKNDDIVAALLDGNEVEGTVKTCKKVNRRVWLMPHNPAHAPIPGDNAIIRGKVVAVLRQV